ncbi:signal peptidase II [Candidatus Pelagibacter sp.]|jgi:signal peptidase II|nr:signal peptidase II [Candidatus Pelagibacter sp.]
MIFKNLKKNHYINLIIVIFIFTLDRISKIYVLYLNDKYQDGEIFSSKFLNISLIWNDGIAFGLLSFDQSYTYNALTFIIAAIIFILLIMIIKNEGLKQYSFLIIFSGAIGNLFDRVYYKAVPDFIDLHINNFHWFIFNVSDIFITLGVIFMILIEIVSKDKPIKNYD